MANFNEKINSHNALFLLDSEDYVIKRVVTMDMLESEFEYNMRYLKIGYRLFIQYKDTCRAQGMAGRCYMWSCTSNTRCGGDVRNLCLDRDGNGDLDNFGNPKFDYIDGAMLITDKYVITYGDTWFEAVDLEEKHVVCKAYVCGRMVSKFSIPAEVFDRHFGLKENFPEQYEKVFGKAEDAQPVQEENDLIEEAKRNIKSCMNLLDTNECQLERAMDAIQLALIDIEDQKRELVVMLSKLDDPLRKLKQGFELSGNSE